MVPTRSTGRPAFAFHGGRGEPIQVFFLTFLSGRLGHPRFGDWKPDQIGFRFPTIVVFTSPLRMLSLGGNYQFISLRMEGTTPWVAHNRSVVASSKPLRKRAVVCWWMLQWTRWRCGCCGLQYGRWSAVTPVIAIVGLVLDLGISRSPP